MVKTAEQLKEIIRAERALKDEKLGLPHRWGFKHYKWSREMYESRNRMNLLCAANQISKSSTAIRKCIEMAGNPDVWPTYWQTRPQQFWYLYPSREVSTIEFEKKWVTEFLPRGDYKDHPTWGWKVEYKHGSVHELKFNSGVSVYFRAYSQGTGGYNKLQSGTVHALFVDEELPVELFDELWLRLEAVDGLFMAVFTATIGQELWYRAIERVGCLDEAFKDAFKKQISMYDCLTYEDGTKTAWSKAKIQRVKNKCSTPAEVQRRVYGRFVVDSGLIYPSFNRDVNYISPEQFRLKNKITGTHLIPANWEVYSAVDPGGGGDGHPAAMAFIAVRPDKQYGAVFKACRMDGILTTSADILDKYRILRGNMRPVVQVYDWQAKDFFTYSSRLGETFQKAEKSHDKGEDILNTLFKNKMLDVLNIPDELELGKLVNELTTLTHNVSKTHAKDDLCDVCRYAAIAVPWDFAAITDEFMVEVEKAKAPEMSDIELRRAAFLPREDTLQEIEDEISFFNDLY